jgi:multiple sugar transport system substrate-binding protein
MQRTLQIGIAAFIIFFLIVSAGFAGGKTEKAEESKDVTIRLGLLARGISDSLKPFIPEFEEQTGIEVELEQHAYDSLRDKMTLEFAAGSGYFDIVYLSPGYLGELVANDYIMPLNDLMAEQGFEKDDFMNAAIEISKYGKGEEIWGFPYLADTSILLYRKDLFNDPDERADFKSEYGYELPIPSVENQITTEQFLDLAEFFTRDGMFGYGYPQTGVAYGNLHIMPWIWTFGGNYYNEELEATLNTPETIEAVRFAKQLQNYQPEGALGWNYGDHITRFYEGDIAMVQGWFHMGLEANDPEQSNIAGNVGYAPVPYHPESGLEHGKAVLGGGSVAITADSKNPQAAFRYLNWMFGDTERALEWYLAGGGATRPEIYEHPRVHEEYPWATDFFPVANYSLKNIARQRPTLPIANKMFEVMAQMWDEVALGRTSPEEGVQNAHKQLEELLEEYRQTR